MADEINNIPPVDIVNDNISNDISDIPELVNQPTPATHLQKSELDFGDLLVMGQQLCGENVNFKLQFDSQITDGSKVIVRKPTGEFVFSVRLRYRNIGRVTDDKKNMVIPVFFTDLEKLESLEIYVENNANDKNKVESS